MPVVQVIIGAFVAIRQHSSTAEASFASFPHFWFIAAQLFALVGFILCSVSFYRRDFLVGLYALVGSACVRMLRFPRQVDSYLLMRASNLPW